MSVYTAAIRRVCASTVQPFLAFFKLFWLFYFRSKFTTIFRIETKTDKITNFTDFSNSPNPLLKLSVCKRKYWRQTSSVTRFVALLRNQRANTFIHRESSHYTQQLSGSYHLSDSACSEAHMLLQPLCRVIVFARERGTQTKNDAVVLRLLGLWLK